MIVCIICGVSSITMCTPCKLIFCVKHEAIYQIRNINPHNFIAPDGPKFPLQLFHLQEIQIINKKLNQSTQAIPVPSKELRDLEVQCTDKLSESSRKLDHLRTMNLTDLKDVLIQNHQIFLEAQISGIHTISITSDNKYVIYASSEMNIRIWNIENNRQEPFLQLDYYITCGIVITSDNKYIIVASRDIRVWNLQARIQEFRLIYPYFHIVHLLTITNNNNHIISATSDGYVIIWDFHNRVQEAMLKDGGHDNCTDFILAPTKDDKYLLKAKRYSLVIWNLQTKVREVILLSDEAVMCMLTADSLLNITGSSSGVITLRIYIREKQVALLKGKATGIDFLPIQCETLIASEFEDQNANSRSIQLEINGGLVEYNSRGKEYRLITTDKKYIIYSSDRSIIRLDISNETKELILENHTDIIGEILLSRDDNYIVFLSRNQNNLNFLSINEKKIKCALQGHTNRITSAAITRNNKYMVSGSYDKTVRIWNIQDKMQEAVLEGHTDSVTCVAISLDNKYVISASDDCTIRIWDLVKKDRKLAESALIVDISIKCIAARSNRYIVSSLPYNIVKVWKVSKQRRLY